MNNMSSSSKCLEESECNKREFSLKKVVERERKNIDTNKSIYDSIHCDRVSTKMRMSEREYVIILPGHFGISILISAGII